jgi:hypothetical protein
MGSYYRDEVGTDRMTPARLEKLRKALDVMMLTNFIPGSTHGVSCIFEEEGHIYYRISVQNHRSTHLSLLSFKMFKNPGIAYLYEIRADREGGVWSKHQFGRISNIGDNCAQTVRNLVIRGLFGTPDTSVPSGIYDAVSTMDRAG